MFRPPHIALLAAAMALAGSCNIYNDSLLVDGPGGFGGAPLGGGIGWWSGTDPGSKCATAGMPGPEDRPATSDPGGSIPPIVFGVRSMRLGSLDDNGTLSETAWHDIGFDIDGTCTRSPGCEQFEPVVSCKSNSPSTIPSDGNFCRDNMFGRLEYAVATNPDIGVRFGLNDRTFNCSICEGAYNMLFKLTDYNGQPNDASVRVDIYPSPGIETLKSIDCNTATEWEQEACWKKSDPWAIQSDYVSEPIGSTTIGPSKIDDPVAFVRDGYAVVRLPANTRFWFPDDRGVATAFPLVVEGGLVTGKLEKSEDGSWSLTDGIIAGRMDYQDAIDAFRFIGMCEGDMLGDLVTGFAKTWADVLTSGDVVPDIPCDALSVGMAFTASEATMGAVAKVDIPDPCLPVADAGTDANAETDAAVDGGD